MRARMIGFVGLVVLGLIGCAKQSNGTTITRLATPNTLPNSWLGIFPPEVFGNPEFSLSKGNRYVFVQFSPANQDIWVTNMDGSTTPISLTTSLANDYHPSWSPDATQIVFVSERDNNPEIYVMNGDGTEQTRLTNNSVKDIAPVWSPDGQFIAFVSNREQHSDVYRMRRDGTEQTRITNEGVADYGLAWSADGRFIAYLSLAENGQLFLITPDGNQRISFLDFVDPHRSLLRLDPDGPERNCSAFKSQLEAQLFYFAAGGPLVDKHNLDQGGMRGLVCESLLSP